MMVEIGGGVVSGLALRSARRRAGMTQASLADAVNVSVESVKKWESSGKPLTHARVATLSALRFELQVAGAEGAYLALLDAAPGADALLRGIRDPGPRPLLGRVVLTRQLVDLVKWPLTGTAPRSIGGESVPVLGAGQRELVLEALGEAAEGERHDPDNAGLRQQAVYLLGSISPSRQPLVDIRGHQARLMRRLDEPGPGWLHARSLAIALANYGDKGPLLDFLDRGLATDRTRELNLRYYAAWLGDTGALISWGELWKTGSTSEWSEYTVLAGLRTSLRVSSPILELTARSVRLLLERNPGLAPTAEGQAAARRAHGLLDDGTVSDVARRDLTQIARSREDAPA